MAEELLVEGLGKSFGSLQVLHDVSLAVQPGRILGFLGRNGAGKTTTMRCIFGLLHPDAGSIGYGGAPLTRETRRAFGYMPEERGLFPKMSLVGQLVFFARLAGMGRAAAAASADRWIERLGLADRRRDRLETLSHGNQQRVQLAAALVHDPELLVLDEPFSGLDPVGVIEMGEILREAASDGATILFSSHQLELVEGLCADIAILNAGRVVAHGDLEAIRAGSPYRHVEVGVAGSPWLPDRPGLPVVRGDRPHLLVPRDLTAGQLLAEAQVDGPVTSFRYEPPSLADLFHEAVDARPVAGWQPVPDPAGIGVRPGTSAVTDG